MDYYLFPTMELVLALLTPIFLGIVWFLGWKLTFWQRQGIRSPGLGFLYQWYYYREELGPYDLKLLHKLGRVYGTYDGLTPVLILADPDLIREVLVKQFHNFPNYKPQRIGVPIFDHGLSSLDGGEEWKRIRSIFGLAYSSGNMQTMGQIVHEAVIEFKGHLHDGALIDVRKFFYALAFQVIVQCAYGIHVNTLNEPDHPVANNFDRIFEQKWQMFLTMVFPKMAKLFGVKEVAMEPFKFFEDLITKLSQERKKNIGDEVHNDFLQLMLNFNRENGDDGTMASTNKSSRKSISSMEMKAQALTFLTAGSDTAATIMACAVFHFSQNPGVQDKLIDEVRGIDEINHVTITSLKYLEAVIKESFRLSPPAIRVERQCVAHTKIGNIRVQPGTIVSVPVFAMHRDPQQFSNPEIFDPDRFLEGGADLNHHHFAFLPFGGGPRICVAQKFALMQAKMALALTLQTHRFESTPETKLSYTPASMDVLAPQAIIVLVKTHSNSDIPTFR